MTLVNIWKKLNFFSFDCCQNFVVRTFFMRWLIMSGKDFIACWENFRACSASFHILTFFYMDIQTHAEPTRKRFHRLLSILVRGNDFIAGWPYVEMFESRISQQNRIRFSKISCYRPLRPYGFGFCKKVLKNFMLVYLIQYIVHAHTVYCLLNLMRKVVSGKQMISSIGNWRYRVALRRKLRTDIYMYLRWIGTETEHNITKKLTVFLSSLCQHQRILSS
jgi:hypothetical protein